VIGAVPESVLVYLGLMLYLVAIKAGLALFPAVFRDPSQAAVFSWPALAIFTVLGAIGVVLSLRTGFPAALDRRISNSRRFLIPAALGIAFALLTIGIDSVVHWTRFLADLRGQPSFNIDFPASLFIYSGGAIIVEVIYRLAPVPLTLWLITVLSPRSKGQGAAFWALAALTSAIEPVTQDLPLLQLGALPFALVFGAGYAFNFAQAVCFRKYGFLAAILVRVVFYLVWHILYGNFLYGG
jgi:hypothetical protein